MNKEDLGATRAFIGGATPGDVRQGDLGNCTVMSSLAALARTPSDAERARCTRFVADARAAAPKDAADPWSLVAQAVLASNDFLYVE